MLTGNDMAQAFVAQVVPGLEGIQLDFMTIAGAFLFLFLLGSGFGFLCDVMASHRVTIAERDAYINAPYAPDPPAERVYQGPGDGDEGSESGHYSGEAPAGLITSNRHHGGKK